MDAANKLQFPSCTTSNEPMAPQPSAALSAMRRVSPPDSRTAPRAEPAMEDALYAPSGKGGPLGHLSGFGLDRSICGSVTACERRRDASELCALQARSRTNRGEPMPRRSLAGRGIHHPSSDKTPASQGLGLLAVQSLEWRSSLTE